jgi:hypothetical protein
MNFPLLFTRQQLAQFLNVVIALVPAVNLGVAWNKEFCAQAVLIKTRQILKQRGLYLLFEIPDFL